MLPSFKNLSRTDLSAEITALQLVLYQLASNSNLSASVCSKWYTAPPNNKKYLNIILKMYVTSVQCNKCYSVTNVTKSTGEELFPVRYFG